LSISLNHLHHKLKENFLFTIGGLLEARKKPLMLYLTYSYNNTKMLKLLKTLWPVVLEL
jgi:hypothetical protein